MMKGYNQLTSKSLQVLVFYNTGVTLCSNSALIVKKKKKKKKKHWAIHEDALCHRNFSVIVHLFECHISNTNKYTNIQQNTVKHI